MFSFLKPNQERVVNKVTEDNIIIIDIFKYGGNTYQLLCDVVKSNSSICKNPAFVLKMLTEDGFVDLIDNRTLGLQEVHMKKSYEDNMEIIENSFAEFIEFAKKL